MEKRKAIVGLFVLSLLFVSIMSITITGTSNEKYKDNDDEYKEDFEEVDEFEQPEDWSRDHGVTFRNITYKNSTSVTDDEGNLHVVWEENSSDGWNINYLKLWNDDGQKLINDMKITSNDRTSLNPKIVVDDSNHIYIVWQEKMDGEWKLFFAKLLYSPNNIKILEERVHLRDLGEGRPKDYSILYGEDDLIHLAYEKKEEKYHYLYYRNMDLDGDINPCSCNSLADTYKTPMKPKIVQSLDGYIDVIWLETFQQNKGLFYKKIDVSGSLVVDKTRLTVIHRTTRFDVKVGTSKNIHLVFDDSRYHDHKMDIIYTKLSPNGTTLIDDFLITQRGDDNNSFSPSLTIDERNDLYIAWADSRDYKKTMSNKTTIWETPHDIYCKKMNDDGDIISEGIRLTGDFSFSFKPTIMSDKNNNQHLIWEDDMDGKMKIYYKNTEKPDLDVDEIVITTPEPTYNSTVNVTVTVENTGGSRMNTTGELYLGEGQSRELIDEFDIDISEHGTVNLKANFTALTKGDNVLTFVGNPDKRTEETNYDNNKLTKYFSISYYEMQIKPENRTVSVEPGEEAKFDYEILNKGNIQQQLNVDYKTDQGSFNLPSSSKENLSAESELERNFTVGTSKEEMAGKYNVTVKLESLAVEGLTVSTNFTVEILPVYDFSLYSGVNNITKPKENYNYSLTITVENRANTDQRIMLYVLDGSEYAYVSPGDIILKPGESRNIELNFTAIQDADRSEDITLTVNAESQNTELSRMESVTIEGEEIKESSGGILAAIIGLPWMWIGVAVAVSVGGFFGVNIFRSYTA
ncbi:MAG: CARDB domain-containing protein [Thermoplasmatota archaeon]